LTQAVPFARAAALLGLVGVALGAFGAHVVAKRVSPALLDIYRTAVLYHLVHAIAMLLAATAGIPVRRRHLACALFAGGIGIFSGSLYLMVATGARWLGAVTPVGGIAFLAGWLVLALGLAPWPHSGGDVGRSNTKNKGDMP